MSEIGHLEISQAFIVSWLVKCQHETDRMQSHLDALSKLQTAIFL